MKPETPPASPAPEEGLVLGIDVGGTETRWALARQPEGVVAEGHVSGFSALDVLGARKPVVASVLEELAAAVLPVGRPRRIHAGLTGFGSNTDELAGMIALPFGLDREAVTLGSDLETVFLSLFAPGEGIVVYAGTGSIAVHIDAEGLLHRAGGYGAILDDGGSGYWIAREALRHVWRTEDETPGSWHASILAQELFAQVGGSTWWHTRQFVYNAVRGDIGRLALAVGRSADRDPVALAILQRAGRELARLAALMLRRFGPLPVTLSGRATTLHPIIAETVQADLPQGVAFSHRTSQCHHAAARLALNSAASAASRTIRRPSQS